MKTFFALLFGLLLGGAGVWFYLNYREDLRLGRLERHVGDAMQGKLQALRLNSGDIQEELARKGEVVRRAVRDLGQVVADATADGRVTAEIKAKYVADSRLSALRISVNTTDGRVTLAGTVQAPEDISRAMLLALETDGVREVVSTLQVQR